MPKSPKLFTSWSVWVGYRYLKSKKNSRFLSFITALSIAGVALGTAAMVVVLSVMDGFESELKKRLMATDLHILIRPTTEVPGYQKGFVPNSVLPSGDLEAHLKSWDPGLRLWPILSTEAILRTGRRVKGIVFKGVDQNKMSEIQMKITDSIEEKLLVFNEDGESIKYSSIFIGQELAHMLNVIPGELVTLISPTETEGPLDSVPRTKKYAVEGIYRSGQPEQELQVIFASQQTVSGFLRKNDLVSMWEISTSDFERAPLLASKLRLWLQDRGWQTQFKVLDWIDLNSHLFASLKLERIAMFVILAFIIIVASCNIITTLTLMVLEKKKEIAILKAMGAQNRDVAAIFLSEGIFIGIVGIGLGLLLGGFLCGLLRRYEFIKLPDIYYDTTIPVTFDPRYYVLVSLSALLIVLLACMYPSMRAARVSPLDGIRFG